MNDRGQSAGPWLMAGVALGAPLTAAVWMMSRTWTPWLTLACVAAATAIALRFAHVAGVGAVHALHNRQQRDAARTQAVIEGTSRPALVDDGRAQLNLARTAAIMDGLQRRDAEKERPPIPVRVWTDGYDEDDGGDDDA